MGIIEHKPNSCTVLIFTYGTLKRGFSNHNLIQDLMRTGDAVFKGTYTSAEKYPLVCGPYRVPFLLNMPGSGNRVTGELYAVSGYGLSRMDELEGTGSGHYERRPIRVMPEGGGGVGEVLTSGAEAYFAHESYDKELWWKNGKVGFCCYTEKEAKGYVKRKDRPQNLSFLEHIRNFVSSPTEF